MIGSMRTQSRVTLQVGENSNGWMAAGFRMTGMNQSLNGTYHGVSGSFTCDSTCNLETQTDGALVLHGDWTFTPIRSTTNYYRSGVAQDQDTEYLYFGIWASEPTDAAQDHGFKWIAGGNTGTGTLGNLNSLTGSAMFRGGAVGKYALKKVANREARIGTFTATATFTADFGTAGAAGEISGSITDFHEGGTSLTGGWSVTLTETAPTLAIPDDAVALAAIMSGVATARIGGIGATGLWAASLHGSNNPGYTDIAGIAGIAAAVKCSETAGCPGVDLAGVAGWFEASDSDDLAAIAGAFGAEYKP